MKIVGAFRVVDRRDIPQARLERLMARGLVERKTTFLRRGRERAEVIVLTPEGRKLLEAQQPESDAQRYYAGLVKPDELEHDLAIYGAFREQAAAIEKAGGAVRRVVLDYEFKSEINREMNRAAGPSAAERRQQLAGQFELPVVDERLALPDLRIETSSQLTGVLDRPRVSGWVSLKRSNPGIMRPAVLPSSPGFARCCGTPEPPRRSGVAGPLTAAPSRSRSRCGRSFLAAYWSAAPSSLW